MSHYKFEEVKWTLPNNGSRAIYESTHDIIHEELQKRGVTKDPELSIQLQIFHLVSLLVELRSAGRCELQANLRQTECAKSGNDVRVPVCFVYTLDVQFSSRLGA